MLDEVTEKCVALFHFLGMSSLLPSHAPGLWPFFLFCNPCLVNPIPPRSRYLSGQRLSQKLSGGCSSFYSAH